MIDPNLAFSTASTAALVAWIALAASLFVLPIRDWCWRATGLVVPALLAVAYLLLIVAGMNGAEGGGFGSIEELRALFANDSALAAGWLHYLAFDLFVGTWIARDGIRMRIPSLLLIPCLALTFLFGPVGLLLYLFLRFAFRGRQPAKVTA